MFRVIDAVKTLGLRKWRHADETETEAELAMVMASSEHEEDRQYEPGESGRAWRRAYTSRSL